MGQRVLERVFRFDTRGYAIRVWVAADIAGLAHMSFTDCGKLVDEAVRRNYGPEDDSMSVARYIADAQPHRINAVEVLNPNGNGSLAYNDWP